MQETENINKDVPDTKAMVRRLEETTGIAGATLEKLQIQGDQMNRVIDMNNEHTDHLYVADRLTTQLSFGGRIKNLFTKKSANTTTPHPQMSKEQEAEQKKEKKRKDKEEKAREKAKAKEKELTPEDKIWAERAANGIAPDGSPCPVDLSAAQLELIQEQDRDLDQMANILYSLKEMSHVTNTELQSHSVKLDVIDEQVEKNLYSTKKTTARLNAKYG